MRRLLFALPFVAFAACTYDWTVGPPGGSSSGSASDSGSSGSSGDDGATNADGASGDCDGFKAQIGIARAGIISCSGTCAESAKNECGCTIPVVDAQSAEAKKYVAAVAAFKNAGCVPDCSSGCNTVVHQCFSSVCA